MNAGDTFFLVLPFDDDHLWVVISDPSLDAQNVVAVNFTSWRADKDQACIVQPGVHPFITSKSCIAYRDARVRPDQYWNTRVESGGAKQQNAVTAALLARIRQGAKVSKFIELEKLKILEDQGVI